MGNIFSKCHVKPESFVNVMENTKNVVIVQREKQNKIQGSLQTYFTCRPHSCPSLCLENKDALHYIAALNCCICLFVMFFAPEASQHSYIELLTALLDVSMKENLNIYFKICK